jgi:hypothetical protein
MQKCHPGLWVALESMVVDYQEPSSSVLYNLPLLATRLYFFGPNTAPTFGPSKHLKVAGIQASDMGMRCVLWDLPNYKAITFFF